MRDAGLSELERDIAGTRARLAHNIARLQSPGGIGEFKSIVTSEVTDTKQRVMDGAKERASSLALDMVEQLKAKAVANPTAALAIGAGIAWKLFKDPPIASALVGLGLYSLLRTRADGHHDWSEMPGRLGHQAADFAQLAAGKATEAAKQVGHHAAELADHTRQEASELAAAAIDKARNLAQRAGEAGRSAADDVREYAAELTGQSQAYGAEAGVKMEQRARSMEGYASDLLDDTRMKVHDFSDAASDLLTRSKENLSASRDQLLLGAAGLAVAVALGIAYQRGREP